MKSLNDLIWDKDSDLEEGKEDAIIKSRMKEICMVNSCGLSMLCMIERSYNNMLHCSK